MLQPLTTTFSIKGTGFKSFKDIMKGYDDLSKKFKTTEKEQNKFWSDQSKRFRKFTSAIRSGTVAIGNGFRKMGDVAGGSFNSIRSIAGSTFKWIKRGAIAVGTTVAGAFAVGFKTAFGKETQRLTLETVTESSQRAAELMRFGTQFANVTPFKTSEVSEGVTRLAAALLNPQNIMQQVGDMAAIMNKPLMQGVEAVIDAQVGEFERLKEFGLTKDIINKYGMSAGFGNLIDKKGSVTDINKFNKVMFKLMEQKFGGGMKKLSRTTKGLWSTITGVFADGMSQIVGISEDGTIKAGSPLQYFRDKIMQPLADKFSKWSSDGTFQKWGNQLVEAMKTAKPWFDDIDKTINNFTEGLIDIPSKFNQLKSALKPAIAGITTMFATAAVAMFAANPVLYSGLAAGAVAGFGVYKGAKFLQENKTKQEEVNSRKTFRTNETWSQPDRIMSPNNSNITPINRAGNKTNNVTYSPNITINAANMTKSELEKIIRREIDTQKLLDMASDGLI